MEQNTIAGRTDDRAMARSTPPKYRFLLINAFNLPDDSPYLHRPVTGPRKAG
jgi:hypothetical protein